MKSIKFLAALFAVVLMTIPTFAQRGQKADRGMRGPGMMEVLDLTDAQKAQAKAIREAYRPKFEAIRNQESDREAMHTQMKELRAEQEAEFKKILTAAQVAKLDTYKAERKAQMEDFRNKVKDVDKSAMKGEMKTYKNQNIKPVLLEQRQKLEPQISADDQAEIRELRVAMKAAKQEIKAVKEKYKAVADKSIRGRKPGKPHADIEAIKEKYAEKHKAAQALAQKYDAQITALLKEIESDRTQWESDMREIKDEHFGEIIEEYGNHPRAEKWRNKKEARANRRPNKDKVAFLLMDVNKAEKKDKRKGKRG